MNQPDTQLWVKQVTQKHETVVILIKAFAFVGIGFLTPLTTALAQYQAQDKLPGPVVWIVVIALCLIGAFTSTLSFLSGAYSDYNKKLTTPIGNSPPQTTQQYETKYTPEPNLGSSVHHG